MNKQLFTMIMKYEEKINEVYSRLEDKGIYNDEADQLIGDLSFLGDKFLGLDWDVLNQRMDEVLPTFITEQYEDIPKYLKLYVVKDCEDDMVLCLSTAEAVYLVPKKMLDNENIERLI